MIQLITKHWRIALIYLVSLFMVGAAGIWAYFALRGYGAFVILQFNTEQGIMRVGDPKQLGWMVGIGAVVVLVNTVLGLELAERDSFLSWLFAAGTVLFAILLFLGFTAIIGAN